jgi:glycosyltransferase involved in cell wall biosynthesis
MIAAVALIKDEIDVVEATVGAMCAQVDLVYVADNGSTDGTRELLESLPVVLTNDRDPAHYQSRKVSALVDRARQDGAEWVVPFDADEIWLGKHSRLADTLAELPTGCMVAEAALFNHVAIDGEVMSPWRNTQPLPLRKVALRAAEDVVVHEGNHGATFPGVPVPLVATGQLEVRHFPYRSAEQFVRKARNGARAIGATDLPEDVGKHWRDYGRLSDSQLYEVFYKHFWSADPQGDGFVFDPAPCLTPL